MLMVRIDHGSTVRPEIEKLRLPQPPSKYLQRFTFTRFLIHKPFRFEVDGETIAHAFALNKSAAANKVRNAIPPKDASGLASRLGARFEARLSREYWGYSESPILLQKKLKCVQPTTIGQHTRGNRNSL